MNKRFGSVILDTTFRYLVPFILVYAVYVLFHGEYSPGGGFQAGALFAIAIVLDRLVQGDKAPLNIHGNWAVIIAGIGAMIYALVGITSILAGGNMLEYGMLPFVHDVVERHVLGILVIEIGVTVCVMATIVAIFDALARREDLL